ncbi:hypothetical protein VN97_g11961 [Penicillium thymicola]|uniref:Uncharacterized protein n=1 Tax=Penicillium thymicola TaxID=293382 RepID=A0AAI9T704_PENTH|nr:hypothetical protein VN97_g11961 [Penicillium thymicola]
MLNTPESPHALHQHCVLHSCSCSSIGRASFGADYLFGVLRALLGCLGFLFLPIPPSPSSVPLDPKNKLRFMIYILFNENRSG